MDSIIAVDRNKTTRSRDYLGSGSFASFLIIGPVCFFLGIIFAQFPYDFPLLWTSAEIPPSFLSQLETHLKFVHTAPPLIARILHITVGTGFLGFFAKLFRPSEANMLFDGAGLVLYVIGVGIYITNILKGLRTVNAGIWDEAGAPKVQRTPAEGEIILGREDSLKVLAASNTILALVLVGVLVLQAGQWYAERKDREEAETLEKEDKDRKAGGPTKKKQ